MYPAQPAVAQIERIFLDHAKAEMLKHRHCVGQRDDLPQSIDLEAQLAGLVVVPAVDADVAFLPSGKGCEAQYVACRIFEIGRASVGKECVSTCRSRWLPYH